MSMWCMLMGCNYKPRYSEKLPQGLTFKGSDPDEIIKQMQAAKIKIYEGDVCDSCGSVVNRPLSTQRLWESFTKTSDGA